MAAVRQCNSSCARRTSRRAFLLALALAISLASSASANVFTGTARFVASDGSLQSGFRPLIALADPTSNSPLDESTFQACDVAPDGAQCIGSALSDIDAARAAEGLGPMQLPADFASLSIEQQLLVLTNLERVDRGLAPVAGLADDLNAAATSAAAADEDPVIAGFHGSELASNWVGGMPSTLLADFMWMYDDGPGSGNLACQQAGDSGCWGHRHNILYRFDNPIAMGVGYAADTSYGPSMTELFIGGDKATGPGQADALLAPTSAQLSAGAGDPALNIQQAATSLQISLGRAQIGRGETATVTGRLDCAGHVVSGQLVTLVRHAPRSRKLTVVARRRTGTGGRVRFRVSPAASTVYGLVFGGSKTLSASSSESVEIRVVRRGSS